MLFARKYAVGRLKILSKMLKSFFLIQCLLVCTHHYIATAVVAFHHKLLWQLVSIYLIHRVPLANKGNQVFLSYLFCNIISDTILVCQQRPLTCIPVELHPVDFFVEGLWDVQSWANDATCRRTSVLPPEWVSRSSTLRISEQKIG